MSSTKTGQLRPDPTSLYGPVMLDVAGLTVAPDEHARLQHPQTGGVILFSRNVESPEQVAALCRQIREVAGQPLLIAVDQEGGRVQRFRDGFSNIPAMAEFARQFDDIEAAKAEAERWGQLLALEVQAVGVDFSFAPVLDLGGDLSEVIGDRGFHESPDAVIQLGRAFIKGLHSGGMAVTGKHYPGHGSVAADSHIAMPVDDRPREQIVANDMRVFAELASELDAVMPAHVVYPDVDDLPAGFSTIWLQDILREQLQFDGVIFSDDLTMKGAEAIGDYPTRAFAAMDAGCDMVLVCNHPEHADEVLEAFVEREICPISSNRLGRMVAQSPTESLAELQATPDYESLRGSLQLEA